MFPSTVTNIPRVMASLGAKVVADVPLNSPSLAAIWERLHNYGKDTFKQIIKITITLRCPQWQLLLLLFYNKYCIINEK